jgi:hypothetical protein
MQHGECGGVCTSTTDEVDLTTTVAVVGEETKNDEKRESIELTPSGSICFVLGDTEIKCQQLRP